jgi:aminopeptidase
MKDIRLEKLAQVLVQYSVALKPNDLVVIQSAPIAEPLVVELYKVALQTGAHPHVRMAPDELSEIMLKHGNEEQLKYVSPLTLHDIEKIDARIGVWAEVNTRALTNTDPDKHAKLSAARKPIMTRFMERASKKELRWTGTMFPTQASAQDAGMSLTEYEDFVFGAGLLDHHDPVKAWQEIAKRQEKAVELFNGKKTLRIEADNGTDLTMSMEGRKWINCCGKENFPDGEIFSAPVEESVNGIIAFSFPAVHMGHECQDVKLRFEKGKVVEATAAKGEDFLNKMLDQDEGARFVGEIAIGTNYGITEFTRNTLFDEKIGGTVHLAAGASYPETGGKNQSGLHWDMVCDLRAGGRITLDGQTIHENGKFTTIEL